MKKIDTRKLSIETLEQLRYTAIKLLEKNKNYTETAKIIGVHSTTVSNWWKLYTKGGYKALSLKERGVKLWTNCRLTLEQMKKLSAILIENTPDRFGLNFSLWTRQAIQELIFKLWKISVCLVTVGRYMKKLGFTPQKPIKRAYEQDPKAVKKWLNEKYTKIVEQAEKEKAEIHWLDETKVSSYSNYLRGYAPKGKTPLIGMKAKRLSLHIISSISKLGKMRFMTYKESLNTRTLIKFVGRLAKIIDKSLFLIMDNLAVHHSKKFKEWLENKAKIKVFYLPSYSPELNPDERLNRDLKTHFHNGSTVKNDKEFKNKIVSFLLRVQKQPLRIKNYFNSDYARYAA
jgi:transposase